jgi:hypothetical protein
MRYGRYGRRHKQRGATFLGTVTIVAILGLGLYAGIRLAPLYMEYMAITRAMSQVAETSRGETSPSALRASLQRRWDIEDIKQLDVKDIEMNKVANGIEIVAAYRAEAPFVANVSLVVDFEKSVLVSGSGP